MNNTYKLDFSYKNLKKIYEKRSKKLFSEHLAHYNKAYLIKQNRKNTCLLTSVYNAFPMLFDYDENKYIKLNNKNYTPNMIKELFGEDKILIIDKPELPLKESILTEIKSSINNQQPNYCWIHVLPRVISCNILFWI